MKRYLVMAVLAILCTVNVYSQGSGSYVPAPSPLDYKNTPEWGTYKALRAVGWTTMGLGLATTTSGFLVYMIENSFTGKSPTGPGLMIGGGALTLASVPVLVTAYHYRNKARRMTLNAGISSISSPRLLDAQTDCTPALCLTLSF
ncbi:MAG: hypothetical protein NC043_08250 [Muribaculaceae bacterium]|nr:hypothetical protein [Muribaculaceae bacterium]